MKELDKNSKETRINSKGNKRGVSEASRSNLIPGKGGGRPKGKRNFDTLVDLAIEALAVEYVNQMNEKNKGKKGYKALTLADVDIEGDIFRQYLNQARNGNLKAIDSFLDRRHGKAKQPVEVSGLDGQAIEHEVKVKIFEESIIKEQDKWFEDDKPKEE